MLKIQLDPEQLNNEIDLILHFISKQLDGGKAVIGISGGLDSDVVARLTAKAIGTERIKLFTVIQHDMEHKHLNNARELAKELNISLTEIKLISFPFDFIKAIRDADPSEHFRPDGLLDPSRAKCSVRTVIFSTYQDRGYIVIGTSNRTESETGFFLPFGDALAHIKPIIHLYKTQVRQIAKTVGTSDAVLNQPASAGFWSGEEDLEDLAYWLYNEAPIGAEIEFNAAAVAEVENIRSFLTTEKVDLGLFGISRGMEDRSISIESGLPETVVVRLRKLVCSAQKIKHRPIDVRIR